VVVIGGGYGGMASAARLAKLGHDVTLLEASPTLGGALGRVEEGGFTWDSGSTATLLPAVVRDLFRKSGRPAERELELVPLDPVREHRWADGSALRLPGGSRAAQIAAVDRLGAGLGETWAAYVDSQDADWELLRRGWAEVPLSPDDTGVNRRLDSRTMLRTRVKRALRDPRLRDVATYPFVLDGHDPRDVPEWMGVVSYLEQRFGAWTVLGGMAVLGEALVRRLETRGVSVHTSTPALDVVVRGGRAVAVATDSGEVDADHVVCAVDPRRIPALAPHVARTRPTPLPRLLHLGLVGEHEELPSEIVLHGDPLLVVRTGGGAPEGHRCWTVLVRGRLTGDPLEALARAGLDVRRQVVARVEREPRDLVESWGGSPLGVLWQGRRTVRRRLGPTTPIPGVHSAGAHATPGSGLPFVGLSASLVAQVIGEASPVGGA